MTATRVVDRGGGRAAVRALLSLLAIAGGSARAGTVIYVDDDAEAAGDGASWVSAYRFLQDALGDAAGGGSEPIEIRVGQGTYAPDRGEGRTAGDRTASFELLVDVAIRGGYRGLDGKGGDPDRRDVEAFVTTLTGDLAGDDGPSFGNRLDNSHHVVRAIDVGETAILDGVTVSGGHADGDGEDTGAGLHLRRSSPSIVDCTIADNLAGFQGGGMQGKEGSAPVLVRCAFVGNRAQDNGGGVYLGSSRPFFDRCTFTANAAGRYAGGICNRDDSNATFVLCIFADNRAAEIDGDGGGGGAMVNADSDPILDGCLFQGNTAAFGGGGALVNEANHDGDGSSDPVITDCTFIGNSAGRGGAVYNIVSAAVFATSTFLDNAAGRGGAVYNADRSSPSLTDCAFLGNTAATGGGIYNSHSDAQATRCRFSGNHADLGNGGGGVWNEGASPSLTDCSFTGNTGLRGGGVYNGDATRATILGCSFTDNRTTDEGGGMASDSCSPFIVDCSFTGNVAEGGSVTTGGGMSNYFASPTIIGCRFTANVARGGDFTGGGGMYNENGGGGRGRIVNCVFVANEAEVGGGMLNFVSSPLVTGCVFSANTASADFHAAGGGMYNDFQSSPVVSGCTFSGNTADTGGALYAFAGSPVLANSILWGDGPDELVAEGGATLTLYHCDVQGGWSGPGRGNVDADPAFVDPADHDLRLAAGSPCIDAGHNWRVPGDDHDLDGDGDREELLPRDVEGGPRFADDPDAPDAGCGAGAVVDMGAHEHAGMAAGDIRLGDLDGDGGVGAGDLVRLLAAWGPCDEDGCCLADLDQGRVVDIGDLVRLLVHWRPAP